MPLTFARTGDEVLIARVGGSEEIRKHLEDLGFVTGDVVRVVSNSGDGNIIVNLKGSRLAITSEMARRIQISPKEEEQ
ncbi:MAG: ferrous iron transport protein A [Lachnospiraceae bacterium]|nr:ferrous iron transport protein A [Lachnospiraceae bacterium]MDY6335341.1 FeoA family protein [Lachnospiraceae bacterium]